MQNISLNYGGTQIKILSLKNTGLTKKRAQNDFLIEIRGVMVMWGCE